MGKNVVLIILSMFVLACTQPKYDGYFLAGEIDGVAEGKIVLSYFDRSSFKLIKLDSAVIKNGEFQLKGKVEYPQKVMAVVSPGKLSFNVWLQNKNISIKGDIAKVVSDEWGRKSLPVEISGSPIQDEFRNYELLLEPIKKEQQSFSVEYNQANKEYIKAIKAKRPEKEQEALKKLAYEAKAKLEPFSLKIEELNDKYIKSHPSSFVTANILRFKLSYMKPLKAKEIFNGFSEEIKRSHLGREIEEEIKKSLAGTPGNKASGFSKTDINDKPISLDDFKGQFILLDFWASWCGPCRKGNPHLIRLYEKYHEKGIEFIGIASDDNNPKAWRKAVKKDQIGMWRHVLSGSKESGNNIGDMYAIHTLPTKILIDKEGKIIGRYGADGDSDGDMDEKLKEIFGF